MSGTHWLQALRVESAGERAMRELRDQIHEQEREIDRVKQQLKANEARFAARYNSLTQPERESETKALIRQQDNLERHV